MRLKSRVVLASIEVRAPGEIEGRDQDSPLPAEVIGRRDAEAVRHDAISLTGLSRGDDPLLRQSIHRAVAVSLRREEQLLALEDHRQVGRQLPSRPAFPRAVDPEDHPHPPPPWTHPSLEAHPDATAAQARSSLARQLRSVEIDVEPDS